MVTGVAILLSVAKTFPEPFWFVVAPLVAISGVVIAAHPAEECASDHQPAMTHHEVPVPLLCPTISRATATEKRHRYFALTSNLRFGCARVRFSRMNPKTMDRFPSSTSAVAGITTSRDGAGNSIRAVMNCPARNRPSGLSTQPITKAVCWLGSMM